MSKISELLDKRDAEAEKRMKAMSDKYEERIKKMEAARLPDSSELPSCSKKNPWRPANTMQLSEGSLFISEKLGFFPL